MRIGTLELPKIVFNEAMVLVKDIRPEAHERLLRWLDEPIMGELLSAIVSAAALSPLVLERILVDRAELIQGCEFQGQVRPALEVTSAQHTEYLYLLAKIKKSDGDGGPLVGPETFYCEHCRTQVGTDDWATHLNGHPHKIGVLRSTVAVQRMFSLYPTLLAIFLIDCVAGQPVLAAEAQANAPLSLVGAFVAAQATWWAEPLQEAVLWALRAAFAYEIGDGMRKAV